MFSLAIPILLRKLIKKITEITEDAIDKMKNSSGSVRLVLVGGGSVIILDEISGVAKIFRDKNGPVANAIGTSISQIKRDEALQNGEQKRENNQP